MSEFNLGNFINKLSNYSLANQKNGVPTNPASTSLNSEMKFELPLDALAKEVLAKPMANLSKSFVLNHLDSQNLQNFKMNPLANLEKSLYIKDLMNLPKEMETMLSMIQNKSLSAKDLSTLLAKNISMNEISQMIQQGSKSAMNKMIFEMANASKQGINDLSQIKETMKLINASVSVAGQENQTQTLKTFMLLYLPWLPLQEGVDFELEIESYEGAGGESETAITIMISTRNFGNVKITLILAGINSLSIIINCSEKFPKDELLKRIKSENKNYSLNTNFEFEQRKEIFSENQKLTPQAKVSMSNVSEVNPFLLLTANSLIKHTIRLDNEAG